MRRRDFIAGVAGSAAAWPLAHFHACVVACTLLLTALNDCWAQTYLSGDARSSFIQGYIDGCMGKPKNYTEKKNTAETSSSILEQYCRCVANSFADRVTVEEQKSGDPLQNIQAARKACGDERRAVFIENARSACIRNRTINAAASLPNAEVGPYCLCYATRLADQNSIDDLEAAARGAADPAAFRAMTEAATKPCMEAALRSRF